MIDGHSLGQWLAGREFPKTNNFRAAVLIKSSTADWKTGTLIKLPQEEEEEKEETEDLMRKSPLSLFPPSLSVCGSGVERFLSYVK